MQRTWIFLIIALAAIGAAFLLNFFPFFDGADFAEPYFKKGNIEGIELQKGGKNYTLNFKQQEEAVEIINRAIPVGKKDFEGESEKPDFSKMLIYRFQKPKVILNPVAYVENNLVFTLSEEHQGYLQEVSQGRLRSMIDTIADE